MGRPANREGTVEPPFPLGNELHERAKSVTRLDDRYLPIASLGRGPTGEVYRAYDTLLVREVAVRILRTSSDRERERLVAKTRALAKLSNSHVVAIYDVDANRDDGRVVVAMQYVEGHTLWQWLEAQRTTEEILKVFAGAARGLYAAHEAGIVYGGFRPHNVLVTEDGRALLAGFGTTDAQTDDTALDPRVDQRAFCRVLCEALNGNPLDARSQQRPKNHRIPKTLRAAIDRGLREEAEDRLPTMAELLAVLTVERRRPRWHAAVATGSVALMMGGGLFALEVWQNELATACSGARDRLESAWGEASRETVKQAMLGTGLAYAEAAWAQTASKLDAYADAWPRMHEDTCAATTIRREQAPEIMDLRMACLHRAKVELEATTALLARSDAQVVENVHRIVGSLPPLERCADVEALRSEIPPPDAADKDAVESARVALAEAHVLDKAGKYTDARTTLLALLERATTIDYPPLRNEVLVALGKAHSDAGDSDDARRTLREGLTGALRWRQWSLAQHAASLLVGVVGYGQRQLRTGLAYAETATGLLAGGQIDDEATAAFTLWMTIGVTHLGYRSHTEAAKAFEKARTIVEETWGLDSYEMSILHLNMGGVFEQQGRYAEAEREQRAALKIREARLTRDHPELAFPRMNLGLALEAQGRHDEAQEAFEAALELTTRTLGPKHPATLWCRSALATVAMSRRDFARAEAEVRRVLDGRLETLGPEHPEIARTRNMLAQALLGLERLEEAESEQRLALNLQQRLLGPAHPQVANSRNLLGSILLRQGRLQDAEMEHRAALVSQEQIGAIAPERAVTHSGLAEVLVQQGRFVKAEAEYRRVLALLFETLEPENPQIAATRTSLAQLLVQRKRFGEARELLQDALAVYEATYGPDDARTEDVQRYLHDLPENDARR